MGKRVLLVLPGWGMDPCVFEPVQNELSECFDLIYCDWYGTDSIDSFKLKAVRAMEEKADGNFSLLGWSLGGITAIETAHEYRNKIDCLILVSSTSRFTRDRHTGYNDGWPRQALERMKLSLLTDRQKVLDSFYCSMFTEAEKSQGCKEKFLKATARFKHKLKEQDLIQGLDYLIHTDLRKNLRDLKIPMLLIHGEDDEICPVPSSEYILSQMAGYAKLKVLKGTGHIPFLTRTDEFIESVHSFVNGGYDD